MLLMIPADKSTIQKMSNGAFLIEFLKLLISLSVILSLSFTYYTSLFLKTLYI